MEPWQWVALGAYVVGGVILIYRIGAWRQDREAMMTGSLVQMRIVTRRRWWPWAFRQRARLADVTSHYCQGVGATLDAAENAPSARNLDYVAVSSARDLGRWPDALRPNGHLVMQGSERDFDALLAAVAESGLKIAFASRETDRRGVFVIVARK